MNYSQAPLHNIMTTKVVPLYSPFAKEFFFLKHPFHQSIPKTRMIITNAATTVPTTAPADMLPGGESV